MSMEFPENSLPRVNFTEIHDRIKGVPFLFILILIIVFPEKDISFDKFFVAAKLAVKLSRLWHTYM